MVSDTAHERNEAADYLCQLADLVEQTGLSAREIGLVLQDVFRQSSMEHSAEVRDQVTDMTKSDIAPESFASGLRWQAHQLRCATS